MGLISEFLQRTGGAWSQQRAICWAWLILSEASAEGPKERQMRPALGRDTQGRASAEREGHRERSVCPTLFSFPK